MAKKMPLMGFGKKMPGDYDESGNPKPGTPAFGQRARARRDAIQERAGWGDLRVKTAWRKMAKRRNSINKVLAGD